MRVWRDSPDSLDAPLTETRGPVCSCPFMCYNIAQRLTGRQQGETITPTPPEAKGQGHGMKTAGTEPQPAPSKRPRLVSHEEVNADADRIIEEYQREVAAGRMTVADVANREGMKTAFLFLFYGLVIGFLVGYLFF